MQQITLTAKEKLKLEAQHSKCRDRRESDRIKAVLLSSEGWNTPMIAQALRLHETTILRHLKDFLEDKTKPENGGSVSHLNEALTEALIMHLEDKLYHNVYEIIEYVKSTYDISYSIPGMNHWLHRNDFSYKKPKGFPYKAEPEQQAKFIRKYNRLKNNLKSDELILFMDSVHPSQATKLECGWIRTGKSKQINTNGSRTRINLIGALSLSELTNIHTADYKTINGEAIIDFLKKVREQYPQHSKLHIILDKAGYHRSDEVIQAAKKLNIKLHHLPPYSPNLNPIERLWKMMNEKARNNRFFKSSKDFKEAIYNFFESTVPEIADELSSRITDNFQVLENPAS